MIPNASRLNLNSSKPFVFRISKVLTKAKPLKNMGISRHTFGRILAAVRKKVARSLVESLPIVVTGGTNALCLSSAELLKDYPAMKIAISAEPTTQDIVDPRFGRAAGFVIYDTETKTLEYIDNGAAQAAAQGLV